MLTPEKKAEILHANIGSSDCGVIAIQAITGKSYKVCERAAKKFGYSPDGGAPRGSLEKALEHLGYKTKVIQPGAGDTPATYSIMNEYGSFLIYVTTKSAKTGEYGGHVMALVDGDLHNSKGSWRCAVEQITEVTTR